MRRGSFRRSRCSIQAGIFARLYRAAESAKLDAAIVLQAPFALPKPATAELLREERMSC